MSAQEATVLRVALVGCGGVGRNHLRALRRCERAAVVATVDVVPERARAAATESGARWTSDVADALQWPDVDAVDLCTPNATHAGIAVAAARAGKHLLIEKPLATTLADADRIVEAAQQHRVTLMVAHTHRFYAYTRAIRAALDAGEIGRPIYFRMAAGGGFWAADWRAWQLDAAISGGHVLHNGVHFMDLATYLLDDRPVRLYAQGHKRASAHLEIYDYFHVTVAYASGATAACDISRSAVPRGLGYRALLLLGDRGQVRIDWDDEQQLLLTEQGIELVGDDGQDGFDAMVDAWAASALGGGPPPVGGDAGRLAVAMSLAAERSLATGRAVRLDEVERHG
jgi:predicted dehydrogenase